MFSKDKELVDMLFQKMQLQMYDGEEIVIQQGQIATKLYFISKGECEVWVADEDHVDTYVQNLMPGSYFGEIALLTHQRRTATVRTKSYSNIGWIDIQAFTELTTIFPDVKKSMIKNLI